MSGLAKIATASLLLAVICFVGKWLFMGNFIHENYLYRILTFSCVCGFGGIVYLGTAWFLRTLELEMVRQKFLKRRAAK